MPGPIKTDEAIVLKLSPSGERFLQADLLCRSAGSLRGLYRKSTGKSRLHLDLFDQGEAQLELKPNEQFGFLKDFQTQRQRLGIGANYSCLEAASYLSNFIVGNPIHEMNAQSTFELCSRALDAFTEGKNPKAILLKTLYVYCRDEGYPMREEWIPALDTSLRSMVVAILNQPTKAIDASESEQTQALSALVEYLTRSTHVRLADS